MLLIEKYLVVETRNNAVESQTEHNRFTGIIKIIMLPYTVI